jgi:hypothetical protein
MKHITIILMMLFFPIAMQAMDAKLEHINAIKKSPDYLCGDATMNTPEDAATLAYKLLQNEIDNWAAKNNHLAGESLVAEVVADTMMARRANMYRVFAYVRKGELTPVQKPERPVKPETRQEPQLKPAKKDSLVSDELKEQIRERFFGPQNGVLRKIGKARNFFELKHILPPLKADGSIEDYGKLATAVHLEKCYLIVYDPAGNIKALLGKGEETRQNLKTGQKDRLENYRGCGAIWFLLKENRK